jgi:hypothetical protein
LGTLAATAIGTAPAQGNGEEEEEDKVGMGADGIPSR